MSSSSSISSIQDLLNTGNLNKSIKTNSEVNQTKGARIELPLEIVEFDPEQPRQEIIESEVMDIVRTLRPKGSIINQPVTVWPKNADGKYVLKFGEKRTRASRIAGRKTVPAFIDYRYDFDNPDHRLINFAEQYNENNAKSGLTRLDDCLSLAKLYRAFGNLKDVMLYVGAKSQGTISDKIKVSEIKTNPKFSFLLDYYNDPDLKFKDLTTLRKLIDIINNNSDYFDLIKNKIDSAVKSKAYNRAWVEALGVYNFESKSEQSEIIDSVVAEKAKKAKNNTVESIDNDLGYRKRPIKKAVVKGRVTVGRKKVNCQLLLDRLDNEEGYIWVSLDGEDEPVRANLSKLTLTEIL